MLYGGVFLQLCVLGCLMRPLQREPMHGNGVNDLLYRDHCSKKTPPTDFSECGRDEMLLNNVNVRFTEEKHTSNQHTLVSRIRSDIDDKDEKQKSNLFSNVRYLLFCSSFFCATGALSSVYTHLQASATNAGISRQNVNMLITMVGIGGIIGRLSSGFIIYFTNLSCISLYILYTAIAGIATILLPLYGHSYIKLVIFASIFGFCGTSYNVFTAPIAIKLVGIEELPMAYGFMAFIGGISFLLGPPLTGKSTKDWCGFQPQCLSPTTAMTT